MTVSSTTRKAGPFSGNGATVAFPFAFKVFTSADVLVVLTNPDGVETEQTLTTHYTIALNADQNASPGGTITMLTAPATGYKLTATSQVQNLQPTDITNGGGFYPNVIEDALDRHAIQIQQLQEGVNRSMVMPLSSDLASFELSVGTNADDRALKAIGFDVSGNPTLLGELDNGLLGTVLPEIGTYALLRAYTGPVTAYYVRGVANLFDGGAGVFRVDTTDTTSADNGGTILVDAAGRRWKREFSGTVDLRWFGVKGDGVTDDASAANAAAAYCKLVRRALYVPPPRVQYLLDSTVTIESHSLVGDMPVDPSLAVAQFKCNGNFNAFLVKGSRLKISGIGVEYPSGGALATANAVGFLFGDATTQFSRSIVSQCFVRYAYDGFKANSGGSGTIWGCRFEHCNADLFVNRPFNFDAVNGSTACTFDFCYGVGNTAGGNKPKGFYFNNITDLVAGIIAVDQCYNDLLSVNNGNAVVDEVRLESCVMDAASSAAIASTACNLDIRQIYNLGMTVNVGSGNRGGLVRPPTGTYSTRVGSVYQQALTVTSGTMYKFLVGSLGMKGGLVIDDPSVSAADIYGNGYDVQIERCGRYIAPAFAFMLGTWAAGDFVWNGAPVEAGTAGSKYIITGWNRVTSGAGHVLNTDWYQSRTLTGN